VSLSNGCLLFQNPKCLNKRELESFSFPLVLVVYFCCKLLIFLCLLFILVLFSLPSLSCSERFLNFFLLSFLLLSFFFPSFLPFSLFLLPFLFFAWRLLLHISCFVMLLLVPSLVLHFALTYSFTFWPIVTYSICHTLPCYYLFYPSYLALLLPTSSLMFYSTRSLLCTSPYYSLFLPSHFALLPTYSFAFRSTIST